MALQTVEELAQAFLDPGTPTRNFVGADLASAVAMSGITNKCHRVSGVAAMTTIALPYPGFAGSIFFIPTAVFTFATGGAAGTAIALAGSAVVAKILQFTFLPAPGGSTGLWYPSYIA